jgi:hypothetical protein
MDLRHIRVMYWRTGTPLLKPRSYAVAAHPEEDPPADTTVILMGKPMAVIAR